MPNDWSHHFLETERHQKKAKASLVAAQSVGPAAIAVALVQAECSLLEAINAMREALASVRAKQQHPGSF
jgi:flavin reductase (DIM6/NTAB) family NADH-FMN oxidoreductase RutF